MRRILFALFASFALTAGAVPLTVCDFEDYEIGTVWPLWHVYGGSFTSTAVVEADPLDPSNKVLHVKLNDWCVHPEFLLPTELRGKALADRYQKVTCRFFRSTAEAEGTDWKQFAVFVGSQELYRDEGYPAQGDKGVWQERAYSIAGLEEDNSSDKLRLGIHHDASDYYLDDIRLSGFLDEFVTVEDGGTLDYCVNNTSSSYKTISDNILVPDGQSVNVRTSRYSEWTGRLVGGGRLNIYSGGERSYLGTQSSKGSTYPDWYGFSGEVHLYPYKEMVGSCGFYGLLMNSGTFQPDNIEGSKTNVLLADKRLVLHEGSTLAMESGTRGVRIGELQMEYGSTLAGYYKASSAASYYLVGGLGTDAVLAGRIASTANGNKVGLVKEGQGICTITGTDNDINGGIRLMEGTLLIDNDAAATVASRLSGATGKSGTLMVCQGAVLGGGGTVAASTEVYGKLCPGSAAPGTLTFIDAVSATSDVKVTLHPEANLVCRVSGVSSYASLDIHGTLAYSPRKQDFEESDRMPRLTIQLADDASLSVGDELTLLKATSKAETEWQLDIRYPKAYTWEVSQQVAEDGSFAVVAKVVSLEYGGQGNQEDEEEQGDSGTVYPDDDWSADMSDTIPLRVYADRLGKHIGVAAASYRYDTSVSTGAAGLVGREFNMVVAENEMKFDATEPSQNGFSYGGSDAIMSLAQRNGQAVRGHTLAWHSQVPVWLSKDGKQNDKGFSRQELLAILKNHIFTLVGHYKGQVREWDVCNEVLDDDQSVVWSDPTSYKLRPSIWYTYIGEEFIDSAFVWAHQADPDARLYINDYGVEFMGKAKTEAYYNLIKRLQQSQVPIHGCGLQCHLTVGELDTLKLEKNIRRYADLNLDCIITELDIALGSLSGDTALEVQAKEYGAVTRVFLRNDNCPSMLVWGISDNNSWRQNQPLLFDGGLQPKPAYYNVHAQMRLAAEGVADGIGSPVSSVSAVPVHRVCYNALGQVTASSHGLVIERTDYSDGTVRIVKRGR